MIKYKREMQTKKTTISEYIARRIENQMEEKEETNEEKLKKAREEFYLK
jgi:hypothetical protein